MTQVEQLRKNKLPMGYEIIYGGLVEPDDYVWNAVSQRWISLEGSLKILIGWTAPENGVIAREKRTERRKSL